VPNEARKTRAKLNSGTLVGRPGGLMGKHGCS
jgi:hypothetical protein